MKRDYGFDQVDLIMSSVFVAFITVGVMLVFGFIDFSKRFGLAIVITIAASSVAFLVTLLIGCMIWVTIFEYARERRKTKYFDSLRQNANVESLTELLTSENLSHQIEATRILGELRETKAALPLIELFQSEKYRSREHDELRREVVLALGGRVSSITRYSHFACN